MFKNERWAQSSLGTDIALYASDELNKLQGLRPILLMGGVHGDEPEGVWLARNTLNFLLADAEKPQPEVNVPWVLIPVLNVDGLARNTRGNGRGVDLNRNYPSKSWSAAFEKERYNPGPSAASESEIQAVVKLIRDLNPRLIIHCHSWHPMVVCAGEAGLKDAERLSRSSGYKVVPEIGYPTPGSLSQFGWVDNKIPVICIEEQEGCPEPEVWPRFQQGMREVFLDPSSR